MTKPKRQEDPSVTGQLPRRWHGVMPVQFLYTAGVAGERFFTTLRQRGRLAVTRCDDCQVTYLPPRIYCERCFADLSGTWADVAPRGRIESYTVAHVDRAGRRLPNPKVVAYVRIDGTDGGLVGELLSVEPNGVHLDMRVRVEVAVPRRRRGTLADILGFRPLHS